MNSLREEFIEIVRGLKGHLELLRSSGITEMPYIKKPVCSACVERVPSAGHGKGDADIAFVLGRPPEEPSEDKGPPFAGEAGGQLKKIIRWMASVSGSSGFKTEDDAYVCYAVRCHEAGAEINESVTACRPFLEKELSAVNPKVIIALGETAALSLTGSTDVGGLRGKVHGLYGARLIVSYGPEAIIKDPRLKKAAQADMELALKELANAAE